MREEGWFEKGLFYRVDDGENSSFWIDPWFGGGHLRSRFSHLFDLCVGGSIYVAKMRRLGWRVEGHGWG